MTVKRFRSPRCTVCANDSDSVPVFECEEFPGFVICAQCQFRVKNWLWTETLLDANPFAEAILDEGSAADSKVYYVYIDKPDTRFGIYSQVAVRRVEKDISHAP